LQIWRVPESVKSHKMVCGNMETETSMSYLDQLYDEHPDKVRGLAFLESLRKFSRRKSGDKRSLTRGWMVQVVLYGRH
jgi:hypothetical protein